MNGADYGCERFPVGPSGHSPPDDTLPPYEAKDLTNGGVLARIKLEDQDCFLRVTRAWKPMLTR